MPASLLLICARESKKEQPKEYKRISVTSKLVYPQHLMLRTPEMSILISPALTSPVPGVLIPLNVLTWCLRLQPVILQHPSLLLALLCPQHAWWWASKTGTGEEELVWAQRRVPCAPFPGLSRLYFLYLKPIASGVCKITTRSYCVVTLTRVQCVSELCWWGRLVLLSTSPGLFRVGVGCLGVRSSKGDTSCCTDLSPIPGCASR